MRREIEEGTEERKNEKSFKRKREKITKREIRRIDG